MNKFHFNADQMLTRDQMKKINGGEMVLPSCTIGLCDGPTTSGCDGDECWCSWLQIDDEPGEWPCLSN